MAKDVTLADIAARVGVSDAAVSKALSGKPALMETGNIGVIIPEYYYGYSVSFYGQLYEQAV